MGNYDDESFKCRRCGGCCGPHYVSPVEADRIGQYLSEHHIEKRSFISLFDKCPYFQERSCIIYPVRPLVCKLMGLTDLMPCPKGCRPSCTIPKHDAIALLKNSIK